MLSEISGVDLTFRFETLDVAKINFSLLVTATSKSDSPFIFSYLISSSFSKESMS